MSQEWQGIPWRHRLVGYAPPFEPASEVALLEVTGDDAGWPDELLLRTMAWETGLVTFGLFQVPKQPIGGRREDDLIAHTFVEFMSSGDPSWPLLVPMGRAVVEVVSHLAAMGYQKVVVTGASKRGWACWMAAQADCPPIVGIAPRVFDNLDLAAQADKQARDWGSYSPMVDDYSRRSLQELAQTDSGQALLDIVDPVRWLDRVTVPQLLIHGANDPFWTVDATSVYWERLREARLLVVPNQGHSIARDAGWLPTLAAFADACSRSELLPEETDEDWQEEWVAYSEDRRFERSQWRLEREGWSLPDLACRPCEAAVLRQRVRMGPAGAYTLSDPVRVTTALQRG